LRHTTILSSYNNIEFIKHNLFVVVFVMFLTVFVWVNLTT
jgi:hypothetical protein